MTEAVPLLRLTGVRREYRMGDDVFAALDGIDLTIHAGEMVAIVGASGSGKSTLMNILGCLDRPSGGEYAVAGRAVSALDPDALAALRREHFGFIFQRYHLLSELTALGNVEVPAIYAGTPRAARQSRARMLLARLGLGERFAHHPGQLSGGQQQRVSIARALMNGGTIILADEPTGALDRASGVEVMRILAELHAEGHTVILVTHDMGVAEHADRIIEISDGRIVADRPRREPVPLLSRASTAAAVGPDTVMNAGSRRSRPAVSPAAVLPAPAAPPAPGAAGTGTANHWAGLAGRLREAFGMAIRAMAAHKLRTFLTMLGIIIGIASVVSVVALGNGSRQQILADISSLGTNTLELYPGKGLGDLYAGKVRTLTPADAEALTHQPYVDSVTPIVWTNTTARYRNVTANAEVNGVDPAFFRVKGLTLAEGRLFAADGVRSRAQDVVIDYNSRRALFPNGTPALGQIVMLDSAPVRVIGVLRKKAAGFGNSRTLNVYAPYTTVMTRLLGQSHLHGITLRVADHASVAAAQGAVTQLMTMRHGRKDFFISNNDDIRKAIERATQTMTILIGSIAVISLIVGGIGVMNIMLVSVTERTSEIGVRMAVGARQSDILQQFLIEAVIVCLVGGLIGVALALGLGALVAFTGAGIGMKFSPLSIIAAFGCSTLIGLSFGYLPARNAARLDPVEALSRD